MNEVPDDLLKAKEAVKACRIAVRLVPDQPRYQYQLGRSLYFAVEFEEAIAAFERAAEAGYTPAMLKLADFLETPKAGLKRDDQAAFKLQLRAAQAGDPRGMEKMVIAYWSGKGTERNRKKAQSWIRQAHQVYEALMNRGDVDAIGSKAALYEWLMGGLQDFDQARTLRLRAAEKGHYHSIWRLKYNYEEGQNGYPKDKERASYWAKVLFDLEMSRAKNGDAKAMNDIAFAYRLGDGYGYPVKESESESAIWYERAVKAGSKKAFESLADISNDDAQAQEYYLKYYEWYFKAANAGDADAMLSAALAYSFGKGVPESKYQAEELYRSAAELGSSSAEAFMAGLLEDDGSNSGEAYLWHLRAAESSYWTHSSASTVALWLDAGTGVGKDPERAAQLMMHYFDQSGYVSDYTYNDLRKQSAKMQREIQEILKKAGYYKGAIDGRLGPATRKAIEEYIRRVD